MKDNIKSSTFIITVNIDLTWSKIVAVAVLILAYLVKDQSGDTFRYSIPFVVVLITGKQFFNTGFMKSKNKDENKEAIKD